MNPRLGTRLLCYLHRGNASRFFITALTRSSATLYAPPLFSVSQNCLPLRKFAIKTYMSEPAFHSVADRTIQRFVDLFDSLEELGIDGFDVVSADGVVNLRLGSHGTYVLNKQTPTRQVWLSSPVSGPWHYEWVDGKWRCTRDNHLLESRVTEELSKMFGTSLKMPVF